jgi:hypothetical protein
MRHAAAIGRVAELAPGPSQRRTSPTKPHCHVAVGVALVGSSVIAATPMAAQLPNVHVRDVLLTATDIVMDIVRHGEDAPPGNELVPFVPAFTLGPPVNEALSSVGTTQAQDTANQLFSELGSVPNGLAGIFSGPDTDAQATSAPFAALEGMTPTLLSGLTEVDGGIYAGLPVLSPGGILYGLSTLAWTIGLVDALPIPGASDFDGLVTLDKYDNAVDTIYADTLADPVISTNGQITDAVYSSSASTLVWVFDTVENPDIAVLLQGLLTSDAQGVPQPFPNGGVVEVEGNPTDGWTLVNWAGTPVPDQDHMGFVGNLFTLWRELVLPPQIELQNIDEAFLSGDPTTIGTAFQNAIESEDAALAQIPGLTLNVIQSFPTEVQNFSTFLTDVAGGESLSTALESTILGL